MASLKEPQKSIPGGYVFLQPETGWTPTPFSSLDSITQQLIQHRQGRPDIVAKNNLPTDPSTVRKEVESYNVAVCIRNGWTDYIVGGASEHVPFTPPPRPSLLRRLGNVAGGAEVYVEWIKDGEPTVEPALANRRAETCVACPMNGKGGLESYFTMPVSNAIKAIVEKKKSVKLETPFDDKLGICTVCQCPLTMKVWFDLPRILKGVTSEQRSNLHPNCWITNEPQ